jgi:hypothetical protein
MALWTENVGIFYIYLEYFKAIWYIVEPVVNFVIIRYIFPRFGILHQEKSGNPGFKLVFLLLAMTSTKPTVRTDPNGQF